MKCLHVNLTHCYGIKSLSAKFDFDTKGNVFSVYAPNGVMKTSFANTFRDLCSSQDTSDRIWPSNNTERNIADEDGEPLTPECIFVIEPYNEKFRSDRISRLLVNDSLRERYEEIYLEIEKKTEVLVKGLKPLSGLKKEICEELSNAITHDRSEFLRAIARVKYEVENEEDTPLGDVTFSTIFNPKVEPVLSDQSFREKIREYVEKYDELVSKSTFFKKGVFTHNNAVDIAKNLNSNGFFNANHSVYIRMDGKKTEIRSLEELEKAIQVEKDKILTDEDLRTAFENIDKRLTKNADLKKFRLCLEKHQVILAELNNPDSLKQKLWISYLIRLKDDYLALMQCIDSGKEELNRIVEEAASQRTQWAEVISIFNDRFSVPFVVRMDNQEDVILKSDAPSICFDFLQDLNDDDSDSVSIEEDILKSVLSNGERRALYILNIIFEVEARKASGQETLFIVDDIADSFDYKNKYAIIEYLKAVSEEPFFKQIILSHNFDFYRTVSSRLNLKRQSRMLASKISGKIVLQEEVYQRSAPFSHWRRNLGENAMLIASIPFLRNLAEFSGDDSSYTRLTSLLHIKSDTDNFTIGDLESLIKHILYDQDSLDLSSKEDLVINVIYQVSDNLLNDDTETLSLEDKIVLSIAIRLKIESFMIREINDTSFWEGITSNQTVKLINRYKTDFPDERDNIRLLERVNLMTPENIHLNSFMYEPILDLSAHHLKKLYCRVCTC